MSASRPRGAALSPPGSVLGTSLTHSVLSSTLDKRESMSSVEIPGRRFLVDELARSATVGCIAVSVVPSVAALGAGGGAGASVSLLYLPLLLRLVDDCFSLSTNFTRDPLLGAGDLTGSGRRGRHQLGESGPALG